MSAHLLSLRSMRLDKCIDCRLDMFRQSRPDREKFSQIGALIYDLRETRRQDRLIQARKRLVLKALTLPDSGIQNPVLATGRGFKSILRRCISTSGFYGTLTVCQVK